MDSLDRLQKYLTAIIRDAVEDLLCMRTMPYVVVACDPTKQTVSLRPLDSTMPPLSECEIRAPGLILNLPPGTAVSVAVDPYGTPYVQSYASGGIQPIVPESGSGIVNEIDAGYVLITQTSAFVIAAVYFPAGVAGGIAAESARVAALLVPGTTAFLLHMNGGRVLPTAWSVP